MSATSVYLTRIEPEANCHRFYKLEIRLTLFGEFALAREWGRLRQGGTVREETFPNYELAERRSAAVTRSKQRRGYQSN